MTSMSGLRFLCGLLLAGMFCCRCALPVSGETFADQEKPGQEKVAFPPLGAGQVLAPGIRFHEVVLQRDGVPMKVWIYLPEKAAEKMPCVLVGPAGTHLIDGMKLGKGDQAEHLPYVRAGFVVVSFEIDGAWPEDAKPSEQQLLAAARAYKKARGGVANAQTALDFALERVPAIDTRRVCVAGHSSAATLALLVASADPRIKACAAYAPATDVVTRVGPEASKALDAAIPGFADFLKWSSPSSHVAELKCPVFLFHASDDTNVPSAQSSAFAAELKKTNTNVTYVEVARGGHYESMIREGIPKGIEWFQKLPK